MASSPSPNVALYFDADAYTEAHHRAGVARGPAGLMGRQVAGKEFLDAYLTHAQSDTLAAVVRSNDRGEPLARICRDHPSSQERPRRLSISVESDFVLGGGPAVGIVHFPSPPDSRFAWARHATRRRFALSGVTHTLSTQAAVQWLCDLVAAPYEPFDAVACTSRAVAEMVRAVTGAYCDYLKDRFGGSPALRPRLEVVPLGVNPDRFRPPSDHERAAERAKIGACPDEIVILCVGRLSHHAKAHPYPAFFAAEQAARRTGKKLRLVFVGWAAHPAVDRAFRDGAAQFAPSVNTVFLDGLDPAVRTGAWHAADVFVSLPDNIQETFGLVVAEAMASGLPVIGSDWDGYRDLIQTGETGYLVPARMVHGATARATTRLLFGQVNYDHFLAECSQATAVDPSAAADALTQLVEDESLRKRFGAAGRERVLRQFTWERVVRAYESLWAEQERALVEWKPSSNGPAIYPAPEVSFAGYPSAWLSESDKVQSAAPADAIATFLDLPLTNLVADRRCQDRDLLAGLLQASRDGSTIGELVSSFEQAGVSPDQARATIGWLLKYGLLRTVQ
jgi:glycosyltransferase involved in cell wall biosynthesis